MKTQRDLLQYVNAASDLAESVKRNIIKGGQIDDETILKLNDFIIAANVFKDIEKVLIKKVAKYDN